MIGHMSSSQVIQVYISWPSSNVPTPKLQLVDFARVFIPSKTSKTVKLMITGERMAVWSDDLQSFNVDSGKFILVFQLYLFVILLATYMLKYITFIKLMI